MTFARMRDGTTETDPQPNRESTIGPPDEPPLFQLERAIQHAASALLGLQYPDGYWCFELEADCTIPAEYILMMHYTAEVDEQLESKLATYLRVHQAEDGGWPLYYGGPAEISCSVKAYQRFYSNHTCNFRAGSLACRTVFAGGMHAAPPLVSFSPLTGLLLVANRYGPPIRSLHV